MTPSDDEWEYEYDADELESYYVPIDFSTFTPPSLPVKRAIVNSRTGKVTHVPVNATADTNDDSAAPDTTVSGQTEIQVIDLASRNPLIAYNNRFYTCHWATDVGTCLFLSPPNTDTDLSDHQAPLRSFTSFDLLAKSRARIVAVPATLRARAGSPTASGATAPQIPAADLRESHRTGNGDTVSIAHDGRMTIEVPQDSAAQKKSQARFLERWSELRAKLGRDTARDTIPVQTVKRYEPPEGWEAERKEWIERGRQELEAMGSEGMGLRRRRRRQKRTRKEETGQQRDADGLDENADEDADNDEMAEDEDGAGDEEDVRIIKRIRSTSQRRVQFVDEEEEEVGAPET